MAGIVEGHQADAVGTEVEDAYGGDRMTQPPEVRQLYSQDSGENGEDNKVVGDDADRLLRVASRYLLNGVPGAGLDVDEALTGGHSVGGAFGAEPGLQEAGKAGADLSEGEPLRLADVHLGKARFDLDLQAVLAGNGPGGVQSAGEGAGVDGGEALSGQGAGEALGLPAAVLGEGDVGAAQGQPQAVGLGLAVADEEEAHGDRIPPRGPTPPEPTNLEPRTQEGPVYASGWPRRR